MPTMDIVSEINLEDVRNATDIVSSVLDTHFDFRGVEASIEWKKPNFVLKAEGDFQVKQLADMMRTQLSKRKIDAKDLKLSNTEHSGKTFTQNLPFKEGIEQLVAKKSS